MTAPRWDQASWFKSTRSAGNGACIEVAFADQLIGVRDSKDPHSSVLEFAPADWTAFVQSIREGHLDL